MNPTANPQHPSSRFLSMEPQSAERSFAARLLSASAVYALSATGAVLLAYIWMAKDAIFASAEWSWINKVTGILLLAFFVRWFLQIIDREHGTSIVPVLILRWLGFTSAADLLLKHAASETKPESLR